MNQLVKQLQKISQQIRPDSPKTQTAAKQLGIQLDVFDIKEYEQFGGPDVTEEIQKIRYEHYVNRLQQLTNELLQRRKELQSRNKSVPPVLVEETPKLNLGGLPSVVKTKISQLSLKTSKQTALSMYKMYSSTQNYFKSSHESPEVKPADLVIHSTSDLDQAPQYRPLLEKELHNYNKLKQHKIREAQLEMELNNRRLELIERQKLKDERVIETALGYRMKKIEDQQQKRKQREEKLKLIREVQRDQRRQQAQEGQMLNQKLEKLRKHLEDEEKEKQKMKEDRIHNEIMRRSKADNRRLETNQQNLEQMEDMMRIMNQKQLEIEQRHREQLRQKQLQIRESIEKAQHDVLQQAQTQTEAQQQQWLSKAATKLSQSVSNLENLLINQIQLGGERRRKVKNEANKIKEIRQMNEKKERERLKQLQQEFKNKEEKVKNLQIQNQNTQALKHEYRRLKEKDIQENYERQTRMKDYMTNEIMEREQAIKDKQILMSLSHTFLRQAAIEKTEQEKLERTRLAQNVEEITDVLFNHKQPWTDGKIQDWEKIKSLKVAKSFLSENDIKKNLSALQLPEKPKNALSQLNKK